MFGEHDHNRVDPREMLGRALRAAPRPAAADDFGGRAAIGAEAVARMPARQAESGRKERRVVST
jgi:hypothetical protein